MAKMGMTNLDAIGVLQNIADGRGTSVRIYNYRQRALDLAIKALEREEVCHNISEMGITWHCSVCGAWMVGSDKIYNFCPKCGRRVEK